MNLSKQTRAVSLVLAALASGSALAAVPAFTATTLGPVPEPLPVSIQVGNDWFNVASRNASGLMTGNVVLPPFGYKVVGSGTDMWGQPYEDWLSQGRHAALYQDGQMTVLGTMGRAESYGVAVNDRGQVIGNAVSQIMRVTGNPLHSASDSQQLLPTDLRAFLYDHGEMKDLGTLGGSISEAQVINARGDVLGRSTVEGDKKWQAFIYRDGEMKPLGLAEDSGSWGGLMNNEGDVAGGVQLASGSQAFVYDDGKFEALGTMGGSFSTARALSSHGAVAGDVHLDSGEVRSFVHVNGQTSLLPILGTTVDGRVSMEVFGVNDRGDVIGATFIGLYERVPFLYTGGQIYDVRELLDGQQAQFMDLQSIQDDGAIVVLTDSGRIRLSPLSAVPEPASAPLMLCGLITVAAGAWRRRQG